MTSMKTEVGATFLNADLEESFSSLANVRVPN